LHDIGEWIERLSWISYMSMAGWLFSTVSVIHYFSFFIMVGAAMLVDLRVLGLAAKNKSLTKVADQICPCMWVAFWFAILSGSLEAATDAGDYLPNFWYELKIFTVIISAAVVYIVQKQIRSGRKSLRFRREPRYWPLFPAFSGLDRFWQASSCRRLRD
jgi:hypothetical protein